MQLGPRQHEAQLPAAEVAVDYLEVVDSYLGFAFGMGAWKCGKP
jgi:hypothetical protein